MVGKIITFFHKEINGLHQAAYLLAFFSLLSQLLALFRDRLFAYTFGAGETLDIYYAAFRVPDFIFIVFASMVSVSILIPFLSEKMEQGTKAVKEFIDHAFTAFFVLIVGASVVAYILMPKLIPLVFPGFDIQGHTSELVSLSRILLLSPILLGCSNFFANITQLHNRFILTSVSPLFYNGGIILGTIFLYPVFGLKGVAIGVVAGALVHWAIQIPFAIRKGLSPHLVFAVKKKLIARPLLLSLPRTLTLSSGQLVTFFFTAFASLLAPGSLSVFSLAMNLQSVPYGIVGGSYSSAAFPSLSRLYAGKKMDEFMSQIVLSARHIIFWTLPIIALFVVLRAQIVRTILGAGQFSWSDTRLTAACLAIFAISLVAQSLSLLFVRAYYAAGMTKKPVLVTVFSSILTIILGWWFVQGSFVDSAFLQALAAWLRVADLSGNTVLLLSLAFTVGSILNFILLAVIFMRDFGSFWTHLSKMATQTIFSSVIIGFVAYALLQVFATVFDQTSGLGIFLQGFFAGIGGIIAGVSALVLVNNDEVREVWATLHSKIWKAKVVAVPEEKVLS